MHPRADPSPSALPRRPPGHFWLLAASVLVAAAGCAAQADPSAAPCPLGFTAAQAPGTTIVNFRWSGFGGAEGYQVMASLPNGTETAITHVLPGGARDASAGVAPGNYSFWVVALHSGTVAASSCHRATTVLGSIPATGVPFFPSAEAAALALAGVAVAGMLVWRRRR